MYYNIPTGQKGGASVDLPLQVTPSTARSSTAIKPATYYRRPVSVRLSPRERNAIEVAAASVGIPPSVYVRRAALQAAGHPLGPMQARRDALARETARAVGVLGRLASNANQIAKLANSNRLSADDRAYTFSHLCGELAALRALLVRRDSERGRE